METALVTILLAALIFSGIGLLVCMYGLIRNTQTYNYRQQLREEVSAAAKSDIENNLNWEWRYSEYSKVSYEDMALKMWRPLSSFYPYRESLTDPNVTKEQYAQKAN